jgi:hypothetical protein
MLARCRLVSSHQPEPHDDERAGRVAADSLQVSGECYRIVGGRGSDAANI